MEDKELREQFGRVHQRIDEVPGKLCDEVDRRIATQARFCGAEIGHLKETTADQEKRIRKGESGGNGTDPGSRRVVIALPEKIPTKAIISIMVAFAVSVALIIIAWTSPESAADVVGGVLPTIGPPG